MDNQEFTWMGALMVFWALTWRAIIIAVPVGAIVGGIAGAYAVIKGIDDQQHIIQSTSLLAQLFVIPVYIYVIKRLFTKGFGKYRLAVVEKE